MPVSRADIAKRLRPGLKGLMGTTYGDFTGQYKQIFKTMTSDKAAEEMVMTVGLGIAPVKPEGSLVELDNITDGYTARADHVTIALGYAITEEAIEDNLYESQAMQKTAYLARSMAETKELRAAAILNLAFTGNGVGDGVSLINSAHPLKFGGTVSNTAAADLADTSLKAALTAIQTQFLDDRGLKVNVKPRKLIVHPNDKFTAFELMRSDLSTAVATQGATGVTNTNNINSLRAGGFLPGGFMEYDYLTDNDAWFIMNDVDMGLIHFQRAPLKMSMDFKDPYSGNIICTARERYSFTVGDWRSIYGSTGA